MDDLTVKAFVGNHTRLQNLKQLQLGHNNQITESGLAELASSQALKKVSHLLMPQCFLTAESFEALLQSRLLENCRCLLPPSRRKGYAERHIHNREEYDISHTRAIVRAVGGSKSLAGLLALHFDYSHKDCSIAIFETSPAFQLRELTIWTDVDTSAAYFERMASWPGLQSLHRLIINPAIANVDAAKYLAESPYLGQLKALGYYHHHISTPSQREMIDRILLSRFEKKVLFQPTLMRSFMD